MAQHGKIIVGGGRHDEISFLTGDTELQMGHDGTCLKHPTVKLRETSEDGYTYQRDTCPQCQVELDDKLQEMNQKKTQLDQELQHLDLNDKPKKQMVQNDVVDEEWTHPNKLSLEALSQQMNRMQQMQDWLLQQKEQEMTLLRQKVEEQQLELIQKEVEMALLKEKLVQQEARMQHELKLIKAAASKHKKSKKKRSKSGSSTATESEYSQVSSKKALPEIAMETEHVGTENGQGRRLTKADSVGELPLVSQAFEEPNDRKPKSRKKSPPPSDAIAEEDEEEEGYEEERRDKFDVNAALNTGEHVNIVDSRPLNDEAIGGGGGDTDAFTVGNTVASSTYGEDRHKVVNQTVLDPYGDSGQYTGVVLLTTGMPHGLGRMLYEDDGRTYEGDWRHGRWHGFGKATFANGDSYEGEYRFDQRHGRGLYKWNDGRQYDGDFYEDKRHGHGTFHWPDGATYKGDFVHGQREGRGRYTFADGGQYEGDWVDGRYEGYGECEWEDGRSYKGEWKQGMAHGRGVETFADGTIRHDGLWDHDDPIHE